MKRPLLSICIPTYNRAEYLAKSIESIICQEEFKIKQVEIVISDNASTDNTECIVSEYANKYENIYYYKNVKNIGNDNFPLVLSKGNGILRRLCNDTLCFEEGALKYICDIVQKYEKTKPFICWHGIKGVPEVERMDFRAGIRAVSFWITSIACFSIWDNECVDIESDTYGAELHLWQVRKMLELISEKEEIILINKQLTYVQTVQKKNISYGLYHVFYENYFKLLEPYFENGKLTENDKQFLEKDLLINFFAGWCVQWKLQNTKLQYSEKEDLCECVYQQFHNKPYWDEYIRRFRILYWKSKIIRFLEKILGRD